MKGGTIKLLERLIAGARQRVADLEDLRSYAIARNGTTTITVEALGQPEPLRALLPASAGRPAKKNRRGIRANRRPPEDGSHDRARRGAEARDAEPVAAGKGGPPAPQRAANGGEHVCSSCKKPKSVDDMSKNRWGPTSVCKVCWTKRMIRAKRARSNAAAAAPAADAEEPDPVRAAAILDSGGEGLVPGGAVQALPVLRRGGPDHSSRPGSPPGRNETIGRSQRGGAAPAQVHTLAHAGSTPASATSRFTPPPSRGRGRARRTAPRPRTLAPTQIKREVKSWCPSILDGIEPRPTTRGECVDGERPCPFVSCRYHLYLDVNPDTGSIKLNFPNLDVDEMADTCALDAADHGGLVLDQVAALMNVTRERARQLEVHALMELRPKVLAELGDDLAAGGVA